MSALDQHPNPHNERGRLGIVEGGHDHALHQPRDPDAEKYVIGAALQTETALAACSKLVTPSAFYEPRHETLWKLLVGHHAADHPTGPVAILDTLRSTGQLKAGHLDGPYLHDCITTATSPLQAPYYARIVDRLGRQRTGATAVLRVAQQLHRPGVDVDAALADAAAALGAAQYALADLPAPTSWQPVDLQAVLAGKHLDPPPAMLHRTDGVALLYAGGVHAVSGEPESGKTWVALLAAVELLAAGHNVAFVDFEDRADRVVARILALGAHPDQVTAHFRYIRPDRPIDDQTRPDLADAVTDTRLVILDGVTEAMTVHGLDLNSNSDAATFYALLPRWIADHGPAVVLIDHVVKDHERQGRWALGAQHKLAGLDAASYQVRMITPFGRGKHGIARVDVAKDRPGHVREHTTGKTIAEFHLDATRGYNNLTAELRPPNTGFDDPQHPGDFRPTILMERVSLFLETNPGASQKEVETSVKSRSTSTIRKALQQLVTEEYVRRDRAARGFSHTIVQPFRVDGETPETTTPTLPGDDE